jgi:hypothetical protein
MLKIKPLSRKEMNIEKCENVKKSGMPLAN